VPLPSANGPDDERDTLGGRCSPLSSLSATSTPLGDDLAVAMLVGGGVDDVVALLLLSLLLLSLAVVEPRIFANIANVYNKSQRINVNYQQRTTTTTTPNIPREVPS
jgi:hypothetical protein